MDHYQVQMINLAVLSNICLWDWIVVHSCSEYYQPVLSVYNAIFKATTVTSARGTLEAVPMDRLMEILQKHQALNWDETVPR